MDLTDSDDWNQRISKLSMRVHDLKKEISDNVVQSYVDYMPLMTGMMNEKLGQEINQIQMDANNLEKSFDTIEQKKLDESCREFRRTSVKHEKVLQLVKALNTLYKIHLYLETSVTGLKRQDFMEATNCLEQVSNLLNSITDQAFLEAKIFTAIRTELVVRKEVLYHDIGKYWDGVIVWNTTESGSDELKLKLMEDKAVSLQDLTFSLFSAGLMGIKIQLFAEQCLESFIRNVITEPLNYDVMITETSEGAFIHLNSLQSESEQLAMGSSSTWESKIAVMEIALEKVMKILNFLNVHLLYVKDKEGRHLMAEFGKTIREEVVKILVDCCLEESVPDTKEELERYEQVSNLIKSFETSLVNIGFFNVDAGDLMNFIMNIHSHFANRRATLILKQAHDILDKDMLTTVKNEEENCNEIDDDICKFLEQLTHSEDDVISGIEANPNQTNIAKLSEFKISQNIKDLVILIRETLEESKHSNLECAERICETTTYIIETFVSKATLLEKEFGAIPQAAAIFHNNCWYIAHHLRQFGGRYTRYFDEEGFKLRVSYADQVLLLRELGLKWFLSQMRAQRESLYEIIQPLRAVVQDPDEDKYPTAEKCIKQILLQILQLRKVWIGVLPDESLLKCLAVLVDAAIGEFVQSICIVEDVVSSASDQLQMACGLLQEKIPYLFKIPGRDKNDLSWRRALKKWDRLEELKLILGSSLKDIVDRWSDGKGPLAEAFSVVEVKNLIKALYQNTEYRANAITKIRKL